MCIKASTDRLWLLEVICSSWRGPVVVAVFVPHREAMLQEPLAAPPSCGNRVSLHEHTAALGEDANEYPVNGLRNEALALVETSHFLASDIDFIPSTGLYDEVRIIIFLRL